MARITEEGMREAVAAFLQPGEDLVTMGWASEKGIKYYYVALTDRRILLVRLSMSNKVKGEESIPRQELVAASVHKGYKYAPLDMKLLSSMAETSLYIRTRDGKKRAFRFPVVMGLNNKEVPVQIMETLKLPG
jgi:hypothetical protein